MWVNTPNSRICTLRSRPCEDTGTYNANASSSYKYVSGQFNVTYVDGSGANGDYATDDVSIGGQTLKNLQFGIGYRSSTPEAILGIGYASNEGQVSRYGGKPYSNMPQAMVDAGLIQTNAYSIWLDDLDANTGVILFGGVDADKYSGSLKTLPIQEQNNQYRSFIVTLSGMALSQNGRSQSLSSSLPTPVVLDTGSSISYLPYALVQTIFSTLQIQRSASGRIGYTSCSLAQENITVDFKFSDITISVPMSELVIDPDKADDGTGQTYQGEDSLCLFGITAIGGTTAVLGDTFLRSAYVVFDLNNNEISLAQTNFSSTTTRITEIRKGSSDVPGASEVSNPVEASPTQPGNGIIGSTATATSRHTSAAHCVQPLTKPLLSLGILSLLLWAR